jgi:hypothetical protein
LLENAFRWMTDVPIECPAKVSYNYIIQNNIPSFL